MNNNTLQPEDLCMAFQVTRRKQRVWITTPDGSDPIFKEIKVDNTLLRALIKAHSWQRKLELSKFASLAELCKHYKVNDSYASKIMNLNYLSPKIKAMILDGKQLNGLNLQDLMTDGVDLLWMEQSERWLNK